MSVATIAYDVNIPYAVVKTVKNKMSHLRKANIHILFEREYTPKIYS